MKAISRRIDRFCYNHPRFGVPHLIRYVVFITAAVYMLSMMDESNRLIPLLGFSSEAIVRHFELWRLITFPFMPTFSAFILPAPFMMIFFLYFTYMIGSYLEQTWGRAKFNVFYLLSVFLLIFVGLLAYFLRTQFSITALRFSDYFISAYYLHLVMVLSFCTLFPQLEVRLMFIPVQAKWIGLVSLGFILYDMIRFYTLLPAPLLPFVLVIPYFIFCGDVLKRYLGFRSAENVKNVIHFKKAVKQAEYRQSSKGYSRKCTVCGKTDTEYPDLEFRYCSRCNGYFCYCIDHISNHTHVE